MESDLLPLLINYRFKKPLLFLPKAPGAVVSFFGVFVYEKYFLIRESAGVNHIHGKA